MNLAYLAGYHNDALNLGAQPWPHSDPLHRHAIGWAAAQRLPRRLVPAVPLLAGREYHAADTHGDVLLFRERQIQRGMKPREQ